MTTYMRLAAGIAIVAVLGVGTFLYLGQGPDVGSRPTPSPVASPLATADPSATLPPLSTTGWTPYTSSRYGYGIAYPPTDWTPIPGEKDWTIEETVHPFDSTAPDRFETQGAGEGLGIRLSVWSASVDPGTELRDWIEAYCVAHEGGSCTEPGNLLSEVMQGGLSRVLGWRNASAEPMAAFLGGGDTVYVAAIWRAENDPSVRPWGGSQRLLEGFLTTMTVPAAP